MSDDVQLYHLPRVRTYVDEVEMGISSIHYLHKNGNYGLATAFAYLFWPEFIETGDCIVFHHQAEAVQGCIERMNGDRAGVEATLNHIHLDFILGNATDRGLADSEYLGETLKRTWNAALQEQFPDRRFEFEFVNDDDPTLTVWQVRPTTSGDSV